MQNTVNPNATEKAKVLLNFLSETKTGKEPLLRGFEMLAYSPNINDNDASEACLTEVYENRNTMETALKWAKATGGIVTLNIMFALANLYLAARKSLTV